MIRPSSLQIAQYCGLAPRLAEQYPESSEAAEHGDEIHRQIASALTSGTVPFDPGARAAVEWARNEHPHGIIGVETRVRLDDPESGDLITEGTPDFVATVDFSGETGIHVVDWKTGRPEFVVQAHDNLQLHAYALAICLAQGYSQYVVQIGHVVDGRFWLSHSDHISGPEMWTMLDRIKAAASRDAEAVVGPHCQRCYQQKHCPAFLLPAYEGETALAPVTQPGGITRENAPRLLQAVEAMETALEVAKERLKGYAREHGPIVSGDSQWGPIMVNGRRSGATVKELEAAGLAHLIKPGRPIERFEWRKITR